jgi:hypothetical protein
MLSTMQAESSGIHSLQNLPSLLHIACTIKEEKICQFTVGIKGHVGDMFS